MEISQFGILFLWRHLESEGFCRSEIGYVFLS